MYVRGCRTCEKMNETMAPVFHNFRISKAVGYVIQELILQILCLVRLYHKRIKPQEC